MQKKNLKIEKISVVDQVGNAIKEKIVSGEWKPGDKLPAEAEIAETYGVNRLSVRMALQKLITLGIVETRAGEGSFVRAFSFSSVLSEMASYIVDGNHMQDIQEMRYLLERAGALKAAEGHSEEDAEKLEEVLQNYCNAYDAFNDEPTTERRQEMLACDFAVHAQIVQMSGNLLYYEIYQMIQNLIRIHITSLVDKRLLYSAEDPNYYKQLHVSLCRAILAHDRAEVKKNLTALCDIDPKDEYHFDVSQ